MKTISGYSMPVAAIAAAMWLQACGWGTNGLDRMDEKFPADAGSDAVDVISDDAGDDVIQTEDTAVGVDATDIVESDATDANVWPDVSYEGIEGRWVVRLVSDAIMTLPMSMGDLPMVTRDLFIAEGTPSGMTLTFCDELIWVEESDTISTTTTTKAALRDAVAETPVVLSLDGNTVQEQEVVWKWAVADSIADDAALPARDKDNDAVNFENYPDIDDDTHAGVTISVSLSLFGSPTEGERYMAKRAKFSLGEGALSGDGRWINGTMTFSVDEVVLGADQVLLENGAAVAPSENPSYYQFRRVDDQMDCATLVANHEGLFEEAP